MVIAFEIEFQNTVFIVFKMKLFYLHTCGRITIIMGKHH